jgi:ABC-2 type transport system permease protein
MSILGKLFVGDLKRRSKDSFLIGYNIIFPVIMLLLLGYLTSESYGRSFTGYQYYSVVMLPFCIALAIISAAYAGKDEAYRKTAIRFLFTPINKAQIVLSKLFSLSIVISICNLVVLLCSLLLFRLPIGDKLVPIFLLLAAETFAVCALGLFIGFGMKNFILIKNLMNLPIILAAILAGVFYPFGTLKEEVAFAVKMSPLSWINRSLFLYIYDSSSSLLWRITLICVFVGIGFTILAIMLFKKGEYIHGDLPGYEK